ncbi:MAG TPA: thiamine pyrophosphate-dependent enzyme [Holophaga sp.]|nr:thiamine pyrophosphate-dependent enzyme [Holophaga sp.]
MMEPFDGIELMNGGHTGCPGCGATLAMKLVLRGLGEKTVLVIPACCWAIIAGGYPQTALKVPVLHTAFATTAASASGLRAALDARGEHDTTVVGWAGDGGTYDIGFQALSAAAERGEDIIYICYDNEAYMNTGVQRSSSTPYGTQTTTTPGEHWKRTEKKNIVEIMAAHRIPYAATASIAYPEDLLRKVQKAASIRSGLRFLHVYASCPTGWGFGAQYSVKAARIAVRCNLFPLYEVEDGLRYTVNEQGDERIQDYLKMQTRFRHLDEDTIAHIQGRVDEEWDRLLRKATLR